jgi:erythromycin esterase-like protein
MSRSAFEYTSLDDWIRSEAIPFSLDSPATFNAAVDELVASLGGEVDLLGLGEPLHGGEGFLLLRNRLFQRLVEAHGFTAIAIESSFPRGRLVNEYVAGGSTSPASFDQIKDTGFSHGFGAIDTSRELVEWMRQYNADPAHHAKLSFYGFDSPCEMMYADSPRGVLNFVLDYLASIDGASDEQRRQRIEGLLGQDVDWENTAAAMDPSKSIGLSPAATALRIETEDLITELLVRAPELVAAASKYSFLEAAHYAHIARQLLNYHAGLARPSSNRIAELLGMRDAAMACNLAYILTRENDREGPRGKVLVFAHNSHLKCGSAEWQLGPQLLKWWPAGAHLREMFGTSYAVIGAGLGVSDDNGIGPPEPGTLEARLAAAPGPARFIPTHQGQGLPAAEIAALPTRTGSTKNPGYFPLTSRSFAEFDWFVVLDSTTYTRGGPVLP